jgi:hypothetical protein
MYLINNIIVNPIGNIHQRIKIIIASKLLASYLDVPVKVIWFDDKNVEGTKLNELYIDFIDTIDLQTVSSLNYIYQPSVSTKNLVSQLKKDVVNNQSIVIETNEEFFLETQFATSELYNEARNKMYKDVVENQLSGNCLGVANCLFEYSNKIGIFANCEKMNSKLSKKRNISFLDQNLNMTRTTYDFYCFLISLKSLDCVLIESNYILDSDVSEVLKIFEVETLYFNT